MAAESNNTVNNLPVFFAIKTLSLISCTVLSLTQEKNRIKREPASHRTEPLVALVVVDNVLSEYKIIKRNAFLRILFLPSTGAGAAGGWNGTS